MSVLILTKNNFENEVINSDKTVLIDFFATWCGPCRVVSPIVDEIADEKPEIKVCKVDVDNEPELARRFGIVSIPTLVIMAGGKEINKMVGAGSKAEILAMINGN